MHVHTPVIDTLSLAQINANPVKGHYRQIEAFLIMNDIDILSVAESWFTPNHDDQTFSISGYNLVRNDRGLLSNSNHREYIQGEGVACYVRDTFTYRVLEAPQITETNETEYLLLEICPGNGQRVLFASAYRRPEGYVLNEFFLRI